MLLMTMTTRESRDHYENTLFSKWVQYVKDFKEISNNDNVNPISTLAAKYQDEALYKLIAQAERNAEMENLASYLQVEQTRHWIDKKKNPSEIFHLFQLDKMQSRKDIFSNPEFTAWVKYVDDLNTKYPDQPVSMTPTLPKYFAEGGLLQLMWAARKWRGTKSTASSVEDDVLPFWVNSRKTPDEALVDLRLDKFSSLDNPMWSTWTKYMGNYNERYPDKATTRIATSTRIFGDENVVTFLIASKAENATKRLVTKLESAQLKMWLDGRESVQNIFVKLRLSREDLYHNPLLNTWVSYTEAVVTNDPREISKIFAALKTDYNNRPGPLLHILDAAMKFPSMEKAASNLREDTIFTLLNVGNPPGRCLRC
ncbi:hypothetical protein PI124_g17234 [Phytophthora idaei]|nr:hypothetical protein PI124_g17234 [Phytophthora idaei]